MDRGVKLTHYKIRSGTDGDDDFLWEMLYQALFVPEGESRPSREVLSQTGISKYSDNWGKHGDIAYIAVDLNEEPVGAICDTPLLTMIFVFNGRHSFWAISCVL